MEALLSDFEIAIGYTFKNRKLLLKALTHSSYSNEKGYNKNECNERLEFLGDAVLELIVSELIYKTHKGMSEGEMTKLRASIVCEESLSFYAKSLNIGDFLMLGKGEEITGGRSRSSILADAFESVLGAIFLDSGFETAKEYIINILNDAVRARKSERKFDCKTELQEIIQKNSKDPPEYVIIDETGPDHDKQFVSNVVHMGEVIGSGKGKTKKEAEQEAAKMALKNIKANK